MDSLLRWCASDLGLGQESLLALAATQRTATSSTATVCRMKRRRIGYLLKLLTRRG
jgi:hypothetical protein